MVSFVEQAILRTKDESSKPISKINAELLKLMKTAKSAKSLSLQIKGIEAANKQAKTLTQTLAKLQGGKAINFKMSGTAELNKMILSLSKRKPISIGVTLPGAAAALKEAKGLNAELAKLKGYHGVKVPVQTKPEDGHPPVPRSGDGLMDGLQDQSKPYEIGRLMARGFIYDVQSLMAGLLRDAGRAAVAAPMNMEDAQQQIGASGASPEKIATLTDMAKTTSAGHQVVTAADILSASAESAASTDDLAIIAATMERIATNAEAVQGIQGVSSKDASEQARQMEKTIAQLGLTNKPAEAKAYTDAILKAMVATGGDVGAAEINRMAQQLGGMKLGLSPEAFGQLIGSRDEGGALDTSGISQLYTDLLRGNLNKADMKAQQESGLRDANGKSLVADQLANNPQGFVNDVLVPLLQKRGVDLTSAEDISAALDEAGLSKQRGIGVATSLILNREANKAINERRQQANPDYIVKNPTTRQLGTSVSSQFDNVMSDALSQFLPMAKAGLDTIAGSMATLSDPKSGMADTVKATAVIAAAAVPVGLFAAMESMKDPATRPLALSALALDGSAIALTEAAAALNVAAVTQGMGGNNQSGGKGWIATLLAFAGRVAPIATAATLAGDTPGGGGNTPENMEILNNRIALDGGLSVMKEVFDNWVSQVKDRSNGISWGGDSKRLDENGNVIPGSARPEIMGSSIDAMIETFSTSAVDVGKTMQNASAEMGPEIGDSLLSYAPEIGSIIAGAIRGAVSNINVTAAVRNSPQYLPPPRLDVGNSGPI